MYVSDYRLCFNVLTITSPLLGAPDPSEAHRALIGEQGPYASLSISLVPGRPVVVIGEATKYMYPCVCRGLERRRPDRCLPHSIVVINRHSRDQ